MNLSPAVRLTLVVALGIAAAASQTLPHTLAGGANTVATPGAGTPQGTTAAAPGTGSAKVVQTAPPAAAITFVDTTSTALVVDERNMLSGSLLVANSAP